MKYIYSSDLKPYYNIIDIRDNESYKKMHIYNSINIPYINLINTPDKYLNKDDIYYIYCQRGNNSKKLCDILSIYGFNVINVIDGIEGFNKK